MRRLGRRARLRIAVPERLVRGDPRTGHGRAWRSGLAAVSRRADLRAVPEGRRPGRRIDAWLVDGHDELVDARGAPVVAQVYEAPWADREASETLDPRFLELVERRTRAAVAAADRVIAPSQASRRQVIEGCGAPADRVDAVLLGVDAERFTPSAAGAAPAGGAPYVLFAATLHPRKNLSALRAAMAALAGRGLPHRLLLVGAHPPDRDDARELTAAALAELPGAPGRVQAVQAADDAALAALMAGAAAFCLPSLWEGFGLTALEALACGAPVVVSDRGGLPEVVGNAGLCVAPTPDALETALHRVLTDAKLAAGLRRSGRERALALSWEATAEGWLRSAERAAGAA